MAVSMMSGVLLLALSLVLPGAALAGPNGQVMRVYNNRMEQMFIRLDVNRDGRLDAGELSGQRALKRRLKRQKDRNYLVIDDLGPSPEAPSGGRLKRRFRKADRNNDQRLSRQEAKAIPWLARQFKGFDRNGDGSITLKELWESQRALAPPQRRP